MEGRSSDAGKGHNDTDTVLQSSSMQVHVVTTLNDSSPDVEKPVIMQIQL